MAEATEQFDFSQFVEKHGESVLDNMDDARPESRVADERQTPSPPAPTKEETLPSSSPDSESDPIPLDDATLEALGLEVPKDESSDEDDDGSESDAAPSVDLDSLSQYLGYDRDQLSIKDGKVHVRTKVDGELADKSLAELVKGYQLEEHTTRKSMELAEQRKKWEEQVQQQQQAFQQQASLALQVLKGQEQEIQQRYNQIPWDEIRVQNPAEYSALVTDYQREMGAIQQRQGQLVQGLQESQKQAAQKHQEIMTRVKEVEKQKMFDALKWSPEEADKQAKNIQHYLAKSLKYTDQELNMIFDHRFVVLADKARRFDEMQERVAELRGKKVTPRHVVPIGSAPSRGSSKRRKIESAKTRLRETGSVEDAANVFKQLPGILD